jgi:1-deoxy-D-xylulose-5-phosphate reductoisomerase
MGAKISIDSATLANKALEVIEAHYLYGIGYESIEVVVHPQSIVHSFVEFVDGSVLAQVGEPTMELPILYALSYPERVEDTALRTFDPVASSPLTFEPVDHDAFPLFGLGVEAGRRGGAAPAAFNAANEEAVKAFLAKAIGFADMADVVDSVLQSKEWDGDATVEELIGSDAMARQGAREAIGRVPTR